MFGWFCCSGQFIKRLLSVRSEMNPFIPSSLACFRFSFVKRSVLAESLPLQCSSPPQLYIGEACWAFLFGVIIGKYIRCPQRLLSILTNYCSSKDPMGPGYSILAVGPTVTKAHRILSLSSLPASSSLSGCLPLASSFQKPMSLGIGKAYSFYLVL